MDKWFKDILPDKDPYHNRGRDQMRKKRTYFVSRYFIGRKDFRNFFSLFFAMHGLIFSSNFNKVAMRSRSRNLQIVTFDCLHTLIFAVEEEVLKASNSRHTFKLQGIYPGADTNLTAIGESGLIYAFYIRIDSVKSKFLRHKRFIAVDNFKIKI
jgi:hypothetical protein